MGVLLLLLDRDVVRDHGSQLGIDATVLDVAVPETLEVLVEVLERRAGVEALAIPVLLSSLSLGKLSLGKVGDFLDLENAVLDDGLNEEGAFGGLLNSDVDASGEARLGVLEILIVLLDVLVIHIIAEGGLIEVFLFADVLDVGDGEADADAGRPNILASCRHNKGG